MSTVFDVTAQASLIVAVALLLLAALACGAQLIGLTDPGPRRLAALYLEPLSVWCLAAIVTYALAVIAGGDITVAKLIVPITMGAAAALLRWVDESDEAEEPVEQPRHAPVEQPAPATQPVRPSSGPLWSKQTV